jgi:uncharacterized protein
MKPLEIIQKYFEPGSKAQLIYTIHVTLVADFALEIARKHDFSDDDLLFIEEAALLHDIGISQVYAPRIDCFGEAEYIEHGYLGREILEKEGLSEHALVCERHTGAGLTEQEIIDQGLPLPHRDMLPVSRAEKIICYADTFYSKNPKKLFHKKTRHEIQKNMQQFGGSVLARFEELEKMFQN